MATLGSSTSAPTFGNFFRGLNVQNACWGGYTMPAPGGYVTSISAYFDTETAGSATCYVCVWDFNAGTLLASAAVGPVPNGSNTAGGQQWWTGTLATPLWVGASQQISIGFWTPQSHGYTTSFYGSGASFENTQAGSGPGTTSNNGTGHGAIGSYVTYTPGFPTQLSCYDGTILQPVPLVCYDGTHLQPITLWCFDGSSLREET